MAGATARRPPRGPKPVAATWAKLLRRIPGYDALATAAGCTFDAPAATRALTFFPAYLKHVKGGKGGQPFALELWQQAVIANLFGWKRPDGTRRYRECFIYVPRKNGKTPMAAGVILLMLLSEDEPGMEIYSGAADRDQASLIFAQLKGMVMQDEELRTHLKLYEVARSVVYEAKFSSYKAISADADTKHGFNSHMIVIDELHALPNRELVDVLVTSTGARRQPLMLYTTTADFERPSICNEKYDYACKVRDGVLVDTAFLPVIYEAPRLWQGEPVDYLSPSGYANEALWQVANPNLGVSLSVDYMRQESRRAQEVPAYLNTFLRLHLNVRTSQDQAHYDITQWDACQEPIDWTALRGAPCFAGLDLASTSDLCCLALLFPQHGYAVLPIFWLPEETALVRERRSRVPYPSWVQQGYLRVTPGNVCDYTWIERDIVALAAEYQIRELAFDPWGSTNLITQLQGEGVSCVAFRQGFASLSAPMKELDRRLASGQLRHDGHPVARWCLSNCMAESDAAGNLKPSKAKSQEKIDFVVALIMALGRAMVMPEVQPSVYQSRGLLGI